MDAVMESLGEFHCRECSMAFCSLGLLEKHKALFCIGSSIGDPMVLRQEQPERKRLYPKPARTPDLIRLREQRGTHLQNMQGRTNDTERRAGKEDNLQGGVSESLALRNLTNEFHKLRMSIEGSMPNLPKWPTETEGLDQVQVLGRKCAHRDRLREMAEQHNQELAEIQTHNHLLEQQREDIAWQLGALAGQGSTAHLETLLLELRDREERNEEALQQLKDHITTLQPGVKEVTFDSPNPDHRKGHNANFDLISSEDGPLSTQIRALRLDYMQSGGSDPVVLAQMHDMQAEAHTLEQQAQSGADNNGRRKRTKPPQQAGNSEVLAVEQENQRLEEEIFRIQLARDKHRREDVTVGSELHQIQREHTHYMASIQAELESLRREVDRAREGPRDRRLPPPPPFPAPPAMHPLAQIYAPPALNQSRPHSTLKERHVLNSLGPAPYDPAAGFAVFYDLMLGVDTTLRVLRPVAGLYSGGQEVGRPTPLPPTQCQPGGGQPYSQTVPPGNYALLAVKQPMPRVKEVTFDSPNPDHRKGHNANFDLISSEDGPLSTQIRALRLDYMQSGGSDPVVLAQMHDMQAEAHTLEQQAQSGADNNGRRKRTKPPQQAGNSEVLAVEQENQRLEEEIFRIQLARDKHRREDVTVGSELHQIQREHTHYMASIQAELESLRREVDRAREGPRDRRLPPPPPFPAPPAMHPLAQIYAPPALNQSRPHSTLKERHVLNSLGPAPYDPAAGFAVFYDLMLGVDTTLRVLRPVAGLYSGGQEVGRPTPLPPTQCQPGGGQPYSQTVPPGNYALLAVKQPMPRMQPSPSLSLVVELQAAGGLDAYGQEVQRLVSRGWARLELFDQHNQVQSGYWRVPVRALPIRPSLSPVQLNSVPQVGNMELCLRVVNARDRDVQSLAKIDPSNTSHYKYPSMVSHIPATLQGNRPLSLSTLQPSADNNLFSLLPYADHEDPPPKGDPNQR